METDGKLKGSLKKIMVNGERMKGKKSANMP